MIQAAGLKTGQHSCRLEWGALGEGHPTKPFFGAHEIRLKRSGALMMTDQTMESIMLDIIVSLLYRQCCKASLSAIRFQKHLWD